MPDLVGVPDGMAENRVSPAFLVGTEHGCREYRGYSCFRVPMR